MSALRRRGGAAARLLALALSAAGPARAADVFSPGELSRPHAALDQGIASCTRCHVAGAQLSPDRCLACHAEMRERLQAGRGFHAGIPATERACERCHHEHQGRDFPLVDWGPGGPKALDHARTGFALAGKHRRVECARCHDPRLVQDPAVTAVVAKGRHTYLGAPTACAGCHFDEHRRQLGADCARCHGEDAWKPARGFDHARSAYPLVGKHARVACEKCHRSEPDGAPAAASALSPPLRADAFVRFKGLPFQACTDCHRDPHQGRFGPACQGCHSLEEWRRLSAPEASRAFHDRTRYPLRGAHATVACGACHGSGPGARFRGMAFERCTDCHADAHLGQLAAAPAAGPGRGTCDRCHGVEGWLPARFEVEDHARTAYPLVGAHRAVACALCHPKDPALEGEAAALRARPGAERRAPRVSLARLRIADARDCRSCHRDPHAGQFPEQMAGRGCEACHGVAGWRPARFDHARTRLPLDGKHTHAACVACHRPAADGVVRYAAAPVACAGCHADVHAGQLARGGTTDCARCHVTDGWRERLRFAHTRPFTSFALEGKHRVACEKCHPAAQAAPGVTVRRYRPLPAACEGCHADFHRGAFRTPDGATRCAACHSTAGWRPVTFDHLARAGFALEGRHRDAACSGCHPGGAFATPVPKACSACHRDVHAGRLGPSCERCHAPTAWRETTFSPDAHRRTSFPLEGRHALLPCESCHGDLRDRAFSRPLSGCVGCHTSDASRASAVFPSHAGFPSDCRPCHGVYRFSPAVFPAHETCFAIRSGPHAGIRCRDCHDAGVPPIPPNQQLTCASDTADCMRCHSCGGVSGAHAGVAGFACANRKCYECHQFSSGGGLGAALRAGGRR